MADAWRRDDKDGSSAFKLGTRPGDILGKVGGYVRQWDQSINGGLCPM